MQARQMLQKIEELSRDILIANNYELVDVEFVKEGPNWYLRFYIDKDGGFDISDCEKFSRLIEPVLEEKDFIEQAYILEVSSPGIDRILKNDREYVKYKDRKVDIKLYKAIEKQKEFSGTLVGLIDNYIVITDDNGDEIKFLKSDVATCRLKVEF